MGGHEQDLSGVGRGSGVAAAAVGPRLRAGGPSGASGARAGARRAGDLAVILADYPEDRGQPPCHPAAPAPSGGRSRTGGMMAPVTVAPISLALPAPPQPAAARPPV